MAVQTNKRPGVRHDKSNDELKKIFKKSLKLLDKSENNLRDLRQVLKKTVVRLSVAAQGNDEKMNKLLDKIKQSVNDGIDLRALENGLDQVFVILNQQVTVDSKKHCYRLGDTFKQCLQESELTKFSADYQQRIQALIVEEVSEKELAENIISLIADMGETIIQSRKHNELQQESVIQFYAAIKDAFNIVDDEENADIEEADVNDILDRLAGELTSYTRTTEQHARPEQHETGSDVENKTTELPAVLTTLVEQLELATVSSKTKSRMIKAFTSADNSPERWLDNIQILSDCINRDIAVLQNDKQDLSRFIVKISGQLDSIEEYVKQNHLAREHSASESAALHDSIDTSFVEIRKGVDEAKELAMLKKDIEQHINTIQSNIEEHRSREKENELVSREEYESIMKELVASKQQTEELQNELLVSRERLLKDTLTGLPNRLAYNERIKVERSRMERKNEPLCLALWDIDDFKHINDSFGHDAGDRVLKLFAKIIRERVRKVDMFARVGGEEFVLIMPDTPVEEALMLNNSLRESLANYKFHYEGALCPVTSSVGIALCDNTIEPDEVFRRADMALYQSKKSGKNRCTVYNGIKSSENEQ